MVRIASFLIPLATLCLLEGCRRGAMEPEEVGSPGGAGPGADSPAPASLEHVRALDSDFAGIKARLEKSSDPYEKKAGMLRMFILNAKHSEARLGVEVPSLKLAEKELESLGRAEDEAALGAYRKLEVEVLALLGRPDPDPTRASALADEFPAHLYKGSPILRKLEELKARVQLYGSAELEAANRMEAAKTLVDPVQVIALLEGFDPRYDGTPYAASIHSMIKESYRKYVVEREARSVGQSQAPLEPIDLQGFWVAWPDDPPWAGLRDGVIELGPQSSEHAAGEGQDLNRAAGTCMEVGDEEWIDVELHFEAQVRGAAGVFFGARGALGADQRYNFNWKDLTELGETGEAWHKYMVRIEGTSMAITDLTAKRQARHDRLTLRAGKFGIRVTGDRSALRLRGLQARVLRKEPGAPEAESPKEPAAKPKKGSPRKTKEKKQ